MSIDEVMERTIEYGLMMRTATISESRALNTSIRAAIEQHVAEAVKAEREAIEKIAGDEIKSLLDTAGMLYSRQEFVGYERHSAQAQALMELQEAIRARGTP